MRAARRDTGLTGKGAPSGPTSAVGETPPNQVGPSGDGESEVEQVIEWDADEQVSDGGPAAPTTS